MNKIINKLLLTGDNFMHENVFKTAWIKYAAYGAVTKNKTRIQKFKETLNPQYIHQKRLEKARFQHDIAYGYFKEWRRRRTSGRLSRDKRFNIANSLKYDAYQRDNFSMVYRFFDKKSSGSNILSGAVAWAGSKDLRYTRSICF